jgi:O-antigen ligase
VAIERLTSDIPDRLALWYSATLMMIDHPLAGVGPGRTLEVAQGNPDRYIDTPVGPAVNNAHNTVLLAGAEVGLAGAIGAFLVNLAIALAALRILLRGRRPDVAVIETAGAVAILGYLAQGMVNNLFNVAAAGVVFAVVAGAYVIRLEVAPSARLVVGGETQRQRAPTGPPTEPSLYAGDPLSIVR